MAREMSRRALVGAVGAVGGLVGSAALLVEDRRRPSGGSATRVAAVGRREASSTGPRADRDAVDSDENVDSSGPDRRRETIAAGTADETTAHVIEADADGPTTVVVGGMHGDERAGHRAARAIANGTVARGRLVVLPAANASALRDGTRTGGGADLNRQFPPAVGRSPSTPLARAIWGLVRRHDPDLVVDLHSSAGTYGGGDGGVGQAAFPTPVRPAPDRAESVVDAINDRFDLDGPLAFRVGNHLDGDRPMLVHRVGRALDRPGYILETTEEAPLADQIAWHRYAVGVLLALYGQARRRPG